MRRVLGLLYYVLAFATAARVVVWGWSMHPTLAPGEYVLFSRLAYLRSSPKRGDVVLVRDSQAGKSAIIKRVGGVPGDTVQLALGGMVGNGSPVEGASPSGEPDHLEHQQDVLGDDDYFLLGDARDMSTDSRSFGPVSRSSIRAKAWLVYWPLSRWRRLDAGSVASISRCGACR